MWFQQIERLRRDAGLGVVPGLQACTMFVVGLPAATGYLNGSRCFGQPDRPYGADETHRHHRL